MRWFGDCGLYSGADATADANPDAKPDVRTHAASPDVGTHAVSAKSRDRFRGFLAG